MGLFIKDKKNFLWLFLLVFFAGCAKVQHMDELLALQSLSDNQDAQKRFLQREEEKFQNLLKDIKQEKLFVGLSKSGVISSYGTPILTSQVKDDPVIKDELMYRHPGQLFGSEKAFLYFDGNQKLVKAAVSAVSLQK